MLESTPGKKEVEDIERDNISSALNSPLGTNPFIV
jgi:hypothetical protein